MFAQLHRSNTSPVRRPSGELATVALFWRAVSDLWHSYHRWNTNRIARLRELFHSYLSPVGWKFNVEFLAPVHFCLVGSQLVAGSLIHVCEDQVHDGYGKICKRIYH